MYSSTFLHSLPSLKSKKQICAVGMCLCIAAILLRLAVGLYSYSGEAQSPMFGDYEAQRHWMEITFHLPPSQWYINSSDNDLLYWGLDYPPLTAYHSWILGAISHWLNPEWVALGESRGHESYEHKLFMRHTVLFGDVLIFFPAILTFVCIVYRVLSPGDKLCTCFLLLISPGLILIDHGHFQYNSISLGLTLWGVIAAITRRNLICCVAFSLALNYKQMELYHAVPFFCFLLGRALQHNKWLWKVLQYGIYVITTFIICWLPFIYSPPIILQVLHRLFPFARGIYEDKVANFWCSLSVLIKLKNIFSVPVLAQISLLTTFISLLPSAINLLRDPSPYRFLLSLVNCSFGFFLFSFQVHEKSILLVLIPVSLLSVIHPFICTWFALIATFSMYPLMVKDGLVIPTWILCGFFYYCSQLILPYLHYRTHNLPKNTRNLFYISISSLLSVCLLSHIITPPSRWPDLFPVLISSLSCLHFLLFFLFFTYKQLTSQSLIYQNVSKMVVLESDHKD